MKFTNSVLIAAFSTLATTSFAQGETSDYYSPDDDWQWEYHDDNFEDTDDPNRPDKCYGIALSDASDFGPYQAGALIRLLEH